MIVRPLADLLSSEDSEEEVDDGGDTARGDEESDLVAGQQLFSPSGRRRASAEESAQSCIISAANQTSSAQWHLGCETTAQKEGGGGDNFDEDEYTMDLTAGGTSYLSKKKMQYLEQRISDRTGSYSYAEDPTLYKKARK